MKAVVYALIIAVSAAAGLEAGWFWRAHAPTASSNLPESATASSAGQTNGRLDARAQHLADLTMASQLKRDLGSASGVDKWLYWMAALEKSNPDDFPKLARLARGNPAAFRFVTRRWIQEAPQNLFDTLVAQAKSGGSDLPFIVLMRQLLQQWTKTDPKAVIAALNSPDGAVAQGFRMEVASDILNGNPEQGLELFHDWHIENFGPGMGSVTPWADANPQHAAEFTIAHPAGYASQTVIDTIGTEWAKTDPASALAFATSQSGDLANRLGAAALKQWASQDLDSAGDWLAAADDQARNTLGPAFIEIWAKQDPSAALSWSEDNLQGIQLQQAVEGVMNGAAAKDVSAAAAMVNSMPPGEARTAAAGVVAQKWFPNFPTSSPIQPQIISWMSGLDQDSLNRVLSNETWTWSESDPKGMANFLSSVSPEATPSWTDSVLMRQWVRSSPTDALAWAATLPPTQAASVGSEGFTQWRQAQPDAANAWLAALPMNDPRRQSFAKQ